ncbi:MAG: glutamate--cysteine ligase [Pseudomonadota bacterium]
MSDLLEQRLNTIRSQDGTAFHGLRTGIEKESLRVAPDGYLATTAHPQGLGSALTNAYITTDFAEALLEFVTPAFAAADDTLAFLSDVHQFTMQRLEGELLWNASMPCLIGDEHAITLARYGTSNVARMKTIYRRGLSHRYGRAMQTIAGVHFNFSLPDSFWPLYQHVLGETGDLQGFRSAAYLGLARNFRRFGWLVLYLFGASPAMCKSFLGDRPSALAEFDSDTLFEPYATSLRMSDLGYSSNAQSKLNISLNNLDEYVRDLSSAIMTSHAPYEAIGVRVGGQWRQLNSNILQIENEYYSSIRPKQVAMSGERPTSALERGGVEYVEIRSLDINPFEPIGISRDQAHYMHALLIYCLLEDSPPVDATALAEMAENHVLVAHSGRAPALELNRNGRPVYLQDWANEIHRGVLKVAETLDDDGALLASCRKMQQRIDDSEACPSARLLGEMRESGQGFNRYVLSLAEQHAEHFASLAPIDTDTLATLKAEVAQSVHRQKEIEANTTESFEEYLDAYYQTG